MKVEQPTFSIQIGENYNWLIIIDKSSERSASRRIPEIHVNSLLFLEEISNVFLNRWQIPNTIGDIDGKHNEINHVSSLIYYYLVTRSLILLALVDANHRFIYIDVRLNVRSSDGRV